MDDKTIYTDMYTCRQKNRQTKATAASYTQAVALSQAVLYDLQLLSFDIESQSMCTLMLQLIGQLDSSSTVIFIASTSEVNECVEKQAGRLGACMEH